MKKRDSYDVPSMSRPGESVTRNGGAEPACLEKAGSIGAVVEGSAAECTRWMRGEVERRADAAVERRPPQFCAIHSVGENLSV